MFDFKQKKETRRKRINPSHKKIYEYTLCFLCVFFLETKNLSTTFSQKANTSSFYSACDNLPFSYTAH